MELKKAKILAVLAAIISAAHAGAALPTSEDVESAKVVSDLIQAGKLKVDTITGKVMINAAVLDVLREAGFVGSLKAQEVQKEGGGKATGGNMTRKPVDM